jgi:Ca2+-binding EF-hand superfamily protein
LNKVKEGLDTSDAADYLRALGYYPSDYEIECMIHELQLSGRRKIPFEDLVKLYINHSSINDIQSDRVEKAMRCLCNSHDVSSTDIKITRESLVSLLTESAEKVDVKDAETYIKELFQGCYKLVNEISLSDFINNVLNLRGRLL